MLYILKAVCVKSPSKQPHSSVDKNVTVGGDVTEPQSIRTALSACITVLLTHYEQQTAVKHGIKISQALLWRFPFLETVACKTGSLVYTVESNVQQHMPTKANGKRNLMFTSTRYISQQRYAYQQGLQRPRKPDNSSLWYGHTRTPLTAQLAV